MKAGDPQRQQGAGWLFVAPAIVIIGLFVVLPIGMALWVSLSDWGGRGSPFSSDVDFVGVDNYSALLAEPGLARQDLMISFRNTFYYVIGVVPLQTVLALSLAVLLNNKFLKGRTFFRTAFYFPSVVSSVAISLLFLFLFAGGGAINNVLSWFGINGPNWFADPRGLIHLLGDAVGLWYPHRPAGLADRPDASWGCPSWEWFAGPSVALIGDHAAGHLDHRGHLHADVPGRAAGPADGGGGGGDGGRGQQVAALHATSPCRTCAPRSCWW